MKLLALRAVFDLADFVVNHGYWRREEEIVEWTRLRTYLVFNIYKIGRAHWILTCEDDAWINVKMKI